MVNPENLRCHPGSNGDITLNPKPASHGHYVKIQHERYHPKIGRSHHPIADKRRDNWAQTRICRRTFCKNAFRDIADDAMASREGGPYPVRQPPRPGHRQGAPTVRMRFYPEPPRVTPQKRPPRRPLRGGTRKPRCLGRPLTSYVNSKRAASRIHRAFAPEFGLWCGFGRRVGNYPHLCNTKDAAPTRRQTPTKSNFGRSRNCSRIFVEHRCGPQSLKRSAGKRSGSKPLHTQNCSK
jgi:hypothetical protein